MLKQVMMAAVFAGTLNIFGAGLEVTAADQLTPGKKQINIESAGEANTFKIQGATSVFSKDSMAVDPAKKYRLSGKFRNGSDVKNLRVSFGVNCLDDKKRPIPGGSVDIVKGTETELAADFKADETVLKVKDGSEWKKGKIVVFKADASGKLADLPNTQTEYVLVANIAPNADNQYDVTMSKPLKRSYPAGTVVRQHEMGQWFHFIALNKPLTADWQEFSFEFSGESASGSVPGKWRNGTKFAGIAFYANPGNVKDAVTELKDLKLEEVE